MVKIRKWISDNSFFVFILSLFTCGSLIYVSIASSNVPIMDYWRYADALIEKSYSGGVSFIDIYSNNGVHRSAFQLWLYLLNVKMLHWNTQVSMYLAIFVNCISSILIYKIIDNFTMNKINGLWAKIVCTIIVFSFIPYELITQEFAFAAAVCTLAFVGLSYLVCEFLNQVSSVYEKKLWLVSLFILFVVDIIGGAFAVGLVISLLIVLIFDFVKKKCRGDKIYIWNYVILIGSIILGLFLYLHGLNVVAGGTTGSMNGVLKSLVQGAIIICGTSLVGEYAGMTVIYIIGIITLLIHFVLFCSYIFFKLYDKTYIPVVFYLYYGAFYGMLFLGRTGNGVGYLCAPRYAKEAVYVLVADIIVIILLIEHFRSKKKLLQLMCLLGVIVTLLFSGCIESANIREWKTAPYRKVYCDNLIGIMSDIDNYADEDLGAFQADSPELVRRVVEKMKRYELGVFNK